MKNLMITLTVSLFSFCTFAQRDVDTIVTPTVNDTISLVTANSRYEFKIFFNEINDSTDKSQDVIIQIIKDGIELDFNETVAIDGVLNGYFFYNKRKRVLIIRSCIKNKKGVEHIYETFLTFESKGITTIKSERRYLYN